MVNKMYKLTSGGRKFSSGDLPSRRDPILDYLHSLKHATVEEVSVSTGMGREETVRQLRRLEKQGLVQEVAAAVEV